MIIIKDKIQLTPWNTSKICSFESGAKAINPKKYGTEEKEVGVKFSY
jgi:hypothetical protein